MEPAVATRSTWLCPDAAARERMLDMDARLERPRAIAFVVLGAAVISAIPSVGWWALAAAAVVFLGFSLVGLAGRRSPTPEYRIAGSWVFAQLVIAGAILGTGGLESYAMSWLLVSFITVPARFGMRGLVAGGAFTGVLVLFIAFAVEAETTVPDVYGAIFPLAALVAVGLLSTALMRSDVDHRTEAVVDGLTGLLNRRALDHRVEELSAQAALTGDPVAVITGDLDHFKRINDEHGHATGDAVLVEFAHRLRKRLRAFDLAYRLGGEEFLVVLPGGTVTDAVEVAETLRAAIADAPLSGVPVTVSFGVAGTEGGPFDPKVVLAAADLALYEAKAQGRDRVVTAAAPATPASRAG